MTFFFKTTQHPMSSRYPNRTTEQTTEFYIFFLFFSQKACESVFCLSILDLVKVYYAKRMYEYFAETSIEFESIPLASVVATMQPYNRSTHGPLRESINYCHLSVCSLSTCPKQWQRIRLLCFCSMIYVL